jgi:hypothetical protein
MAVEHGWDGLSEGAGTGSISRASGRLSERARGGTMCLASHDLSEGPGGRVINVVHGGMIGARRWLMKRKYQ